MSPDERSLIGCMVIVLAMGMTLVSLWLWPPRPTASAPHPTVPFTQADQNRIARMADAVARMYAEWDDQKRWFADAISKPAKTNLPGITERLALRAQGER